MGGMTTINAADPTRRSQPRDDDAATPLRSRDEGPAKEFDFSGAAYARANLPTGMIATRPTTATLAQDVARVRSSAQKVIEDLKSPELRHLLAAEGKVGFHAAAVVADAGKLALHAPAACEGSVVDIIQSGLALKGLVEHGVKLGLAAREYEQASTPEARAKLDQFMRDLGELETAGARLTMHAREFASPF